MRERGSEREGGRERGSERGRERKGGSEREGVRERGREREGGRERVLNFNSMYCTHRSYYLYFLLYTNTDKVEHLEVGGIILHYSNAIVVT